MKSRILELNELQKTTLFNFLKNDSDFSKVYVDNGLSDKMTKEKFINTLVDEVNDNLEFYILNKRYVDVCYITLENDLLIDLDYLYDYSLSILD